MARNGQTGGIALISLMVLGGCGGAPGIDEAAVGEAVWERRQALATQMLAELQAPAQEPTDLGSDDARFEAMAREAARSAHEASLGVGALDRATLQNIVGSTLQSTRVSGCEGRPPAPYQFCRVDLGLRGADGAAYSMQTVIRWFPAERRFETME
jgi:hypothetical protein